MDLELQKPLPQNDAAERDVLGAVLIAAKGYKSVFDKLDPQDFFNPFNRKIFETLKSLHEAGKPADLLAASDVLTARGDLESAGGIGYLASLPDGMYRTCQPERLADFVKEKSRRRRFVHVVHAIEQDALDEGGDSAELIDGAIERLSELAREAEADHDDGVTHFDAAANAVLELGEEQPVKVFTGVEQLDAITGGFRAGELVVITAETGSGKTLLAQQTRRRACGDGHHSLFASGEMLAAHLKRRELSAESGVNPSKMRRDDLLTPADKQALIESAAQECKLCRILDGELNLARIRRVARAMKGKSQLSLIVLDYDELIEAPGKDEFEQQRNLARAAKSLAMELRCAVILISQLRKVLTGEDVKHPTLQRVYGSGAKTKHASIVILANREYVRELSGDEKQAQIFVLKNRDGKVGRIEASFNVRKLRFDDAPPEGPPEKRAWRNTADPQEDGR